MYQNVVDRLYGEFSDLQKFLSEKGGATFLPVIEDNFPKTMLLAAASYFESCLSEEIEQLAKEVLADDHVLVGLIKNKAISRQYHTWFAWERSNANKFFSMFGQGFKDQATEWVKSDEKLNKSIVDFLEIGRERNRLVHENFGNFTLQKTASEVYELYKSATRFVDWFPKAIRDYSKGSAFTAAL